MEKPSESSPAVVPDQARDAVLGALSWAGRSRGRQTALLVAIVLLAAVAFCASHGMRWLLLSGETTHWFWNLSLGQYYEYSAAAAALGILLALGMVLLRIARMRRRARRR